MASHSIAPTKPEKPSPDFPLFPHASRRWAKKVRGKLHYFGYWTTDPDGAAALAQWRAQRDDLLAGRKPTRADRQSKKSKKPGKPYAEFPLFAHATGRWAKKIRGRTVYFGPWDDPASALAKYLDQRDDLHAGRAPSTRNGATIRELVNQFLTAKERLLENGELSPRSYRDYHATCARLVEFFERPRRVESLLPNDFGRLRAHLSKTLGPVALGNEINRVRIVFKYAFDSALIERAVRYGTDFQKPSHKTLRKTKSERGCRVFKAGELHRILDKADQPLKAMILLGINGGLGQSDIARLPQTAIEWTGKWLNYPRPKTGIARRIPLWPETIAALNEAIAARPEPNDPADAGLVFVTAKGNPWVRTKLSVKGAIISIDAILLEFQKLLDDVNDVPRLGFYALRHTHRTISDGAKDQPAANAIMGHAPASNDMASVYREGIDDDRLRAVTDHVRRWLWPPPPKKSRMKPT